MFCPECGGDMRKTNEAIREEFKGEELSFFHQFC